MTKYMTVGFVMDVKDLPVNPFKIDTPFGKPETISMGNIFEELDELQDKVVELEAALATAIGNRRS